MALIGLVVLCPEKFFTIISMDIIFSSIQRKGYYQESVCVDSDEQTGLSFLRFY